MIDEISTIEAHGTGCRKTQQIVAVLLKSR
jgi:hypothetical protein